MVSQAAYPPYGLAAVSFTGLSCYLIYNGLYFSAISVSQDTALRKTIRRSVTEQSKLLDSIGSAQRERELQGRILTVAKKTSDIMAEETGVEASMKEDDMKDYMELVIKELQSKR
jgi:membrane protein implicated in regulation of membrane protease activity